MRAARNVAIDLPHFRSKVFPFQFLQHSLMRFGERELEPFKMKRKVERRDFGAR